MLGRAAYQHYNNSVSSTMVAPLSSLLVQLGIADIIAILLYVTVSATHFLIFPGSF